MNLQSKYIQDGGGTKYAPITTPNAIRWPDGSNLNDKLSAYDSVVIEAPVDDLDPTDPITTLDCDFGKYYRIDVAVDSLTINLPEITDNTTARTVVVCLKGGTTPAITITPDDSEDILYQDGLESVISGIATDDMLELNFLWNGLAWVIAGIKIVEPAS